MQGSTGAQAPRTPLRADAQRNRDHLVAVAREVFLDTGPQTPMEAIARRAGVGVGTLYRRFPDRRALIQAVAVDSVGQLTGEAEVAWRDEPDAWSALEKVVRSGGAHRQVLSVVRPLLRETDSHNHELRSAGETWLDVLTRIVEGAQVDGALRPDVGPGDIALLLSQLARPVAGVSGELAVTVPARFVELMLDALRARPGSRLPGSPITRWWT